jgi:hypothetical protein
MWPLVPHNGIQLMLHTLKDIEWQLSIIQKAIQMEWFYF